MILENENIIIKESDNGIKYLQFKRLLDLGIKHAYTLKTDEIDFSFNQDKHDISYIKLAESLGIERKNIVEPVQTHTDIVLGIDRVMTSEELKDVDGLITNKTNIAITSKNADCILFFFYDPKQKVIANVHSGWKGTFKKIAIKTVEKMIKDYNSKPENILCFISPSIRKCHFEVDIDVKEMCEEIFEGYDLENIVAVGDIKDGKQKNMIDTVLINKEGLLKIGLKEENIIDSNLCSVCHKDEIHSARAEGEGFQRETAIIVLE